jgi:lambda family phage portal protein
MPILDIFKRGKARPLPTRTSRGPFLAASADRFTASWLATAQDINNELRSDLDRLRTRARDLAKNNEYARKFLRMAARNIVGPQGFILQARVEDAPGRPDRLANDAIEAAFYRWAKRGSAEITGRLSFADLQRVIVTTVARDGEALVRIVRGRDAGNPEGLAFQLLDTARLDTARNQEASGNQPAIVMGVEIDGYGRPTGYWIKEKITSGNATRIAAADLLHIYLPENAEQIRGIPWMHAAMLAMHDLGEFNRSALLAARKGADTLGFIVSPDGTANALADTTDDGEPLKISAPGTYDVLPEGYDIRTPESQYPNQVFDPFTKAILRRISSGFDVAYNALANDLEGVNYSSIRAGVLEERDQWAALQNWMVEAFMETVFDEWFSRAMTAGTITMPNGSPLPVAKADKFRAHEWQGRRWQWVDPLKDMEAAVLAIQRGLASPQQIAAQQGLDLEDIINAIKSANAMASAAGIAPYAAPPAPAPAPTATDEAVSLVSPAPGAGKQ